MRTKLARAIKHIALGGALAAVATSGFAATQGTTGSTSTGDVVVTLVIGETVKISNLTDIFLTTPTAGNDATGATTACIYRSGATGAYRVTASGSGVGGAFEMTDGATSVAYSVDFDDNAGTATTLSTAVGADFAGANGADDDCAGLAGNSNATVDVTVAAADVGGLGAGVYSGVLTLLVSPI